MRSYIILCLSVFLLGVCSCSNDDDSIKDMTVSVWDQPYTVFSGLKGRVSSIKEMVYDVTDDSEPYSTSEMRFDDNGRITWYDPTGVMSTFMLGMEMYSYAYHYDVNGRMDRVDIMTLGGETEIFSLTYNDEENRYVVVPFPVGKYEFFCVKGVAKIESSKGLIGEWKDDIFEWTQVIYDDDASRTLRRTSCEYTLGVYPSKVTEAFVEWEDNVGESVVYKDEYEYTYMNDGKPSTCVRTSYSFYSIDEEADVYHTVYRPFPLMALESVTWGTEENRETLNYEYSSINELFTIKYTTDYSDDIQSETYLYNDYDQYGNWTTSRQKYNSIVDLNHPDGEVKVVRVFSYH